MHIYFSERQAVTSGAPVGPEFGSIDVIVPVRFQLGEPTSLYTLCQYFCHDRHPMIFGVYSCIIAGCDQSVQHVANFLAYKRGTSVTALIKTISPHPLCFQSPLPCPSPSIRIYCRAPVPCAARSQWSLFSVQ